MVLEDQQIAIFIQKWLVEAFSDFSKDFMKVCGHNPGAGDMPLTV